MPMPMANPAGGGAAGQRPQCPHAARALSRQGRHGGVRLLSLRRANAETGRSGGVERQGRSCRSDETSARRICAVRERRSAFGVARASRGIANCQPPSERVARRTTPKKTLSTSVLVRQSAWTAGAMANMAIERSISVTRMAASLVISARVALFLSGFPTDKSRFGSRKVAFAPKHRGWMTRRSGLIASSGNGKRSRDSRPFAQKSTGPEEIGIHEP